MFVIWRRHVPYVVACFSLSTCTLKIAHWYLKLSSFSHIAVKSVRFILATAILDFWRMSTLYDTGSGIIEKLFPEDTGIAVRILLLCALELEICLG